MTGRVDDSCLWVYVVVEDMRREQEVSKELRPTALTEVAPSIPAPPGHAHTPPPPP